MCEQIPEPADFLLKSSLYGRYEITQENCNALQRIESFEGTLDAYCDKCGKDTVFQFQSPNDYSSNQVLGMGAKAPSKQRKMPKENLFKKMLVSRFFVFQFVCTRHNCLNSIFFVCNVLDGKLRKIGQYPSLADLYSGNIKKYRSVLDKKDFRELHRAIGLNAHGIGIGAFVYLRRIFERLVKSTYDESNIGMAEKEFDHTRMEDKIFLLKDHLPEYLIKNRLIYSILSKGIHSLKENECRSYFNIIKGGIEIILSEKISKQELDKKKKEITKELQIIKGNI